MGTAPKIPESVLVVIHTTDGQVLLLERADRPGFWQSVTGSLDAPDEAPCAAARREVQEETGLTAGGVGPLHDLGIATRSMRTGGIAMHRGSRIIPSMCFRWRCRPRFR